MDEIKTFMNNRYRIGDFLIYYDNKAILEQKKWLYNDTYKNSIIYLLIETLIQNININKINFCTNIIYDKSKIINKANDDELVIHLRLGDIFGLNKNDPLINKKPKLEKIIRNIKKYKKIWLVTAYHFGKGKFSDKDIVEKGLKKSKEFLKIIIDKIILMDIKYEIKSSSNIDDDFIFLCTAKNLLISGDSSFVKAVKLFNKIYLKK